MKQGVSKMNKWHLAQINFASAKYPADDPRMDGFMSRLDEVNALAEQSEGFVWRLQDDSGNATSIDIGLGDDVLVNLSVWESAEALFNFVYQTVHRDVMIQRRSWFERPEDLYQVLWWVPAGERPTPADGLHRLALLKADGPGPEAFTFKSRFPAPDQQDSKDSPLNPDEFCSGWD